MTAEHHPASTTAAWLLLAFGTASVLAGLLWVSHVVSYREQRLEVTVTAYNSVPGQTADNPTIGAWGDELTGGDRSVAVSRDLIPRGLDHGARLRVEGLPGHYVVRDKMNGRWQRRIDLHLGEDRQAAREWGRQQRMIYWRQPVMPVRRETG